jgi:signal transduction histidine kinase
MPRDVSLVDLIVHEIRTPLTVALGSLGHAESADPASAGDALARARRSCERIERMAAEMRNYVRVSALPDAALVAVPLDSAIETAVRRLAAERDIDVALSPVPARRVVAVPGQIEDALAALLLALGRAASPSEGLVVAVSATETRVTVVARRESAGDSRPADSFEAEWLGGLGFGLPLARAVVERSGGSIGSGVAGDGRLGVISVTLVAASTAPPL